MICTRRFAGLILAHRGVSAEASVDTSPANALRSVGAAAKLARVALLRCAPQAVTATTLGVVLEDFVVSCEKIMRFAGAEDAAGVHDLACYFCARMARAQPGEVVLVPLGWLTAATDSRLAQATIVLMALRRRRDRPSAFDCALINSGGAGGAGGDGVATARYHELKIDDANAELWSRAAILIGDVPQEKLQDGGIWFVLYRLLVFPHAISQCPVKPLSHQRPPVPRCADLFM